MSGIQSKHFRHVIVSFTLSPKLEDKHIFRYCGFFTAHLLYVHNIKFVVVVFTRYVKQSVKLGNI